ncbi:MAG: PQQ-binding-like beta-propeller repeat protein [Ktedonobacteraceae bacterium]
MREQEAARRQRLAYEKTLYRYSNALERGDLDTIIAILHAAENDPHLEQLIIETHREGYQQEEPAMQPENIHNQVTPLPYGAALSGQFQQPASLPQQSRATSKPRRRWLIALQTTAAVLVVSALLISAFFVFTAHNKAPVGHRSQPQTGTGSHTNTTTKQVGDIIVTVSDNSNSKANNVGSATLTAFNARTHARIWQYTLGGDIFSQQKDIGLAIQDHVVYVAYSKQVQALRANNGKLLWKTLLSTANQIVTGGDPLPQLVIDHGRVYASGYVGGNLYTLDSQTGTILWQYDAPIPALLTINNGIAYVLGNGDDDHNAIKALNGTNGHVLWQYNTSMPLEATVAGNVLYVQAAHSLARDPNGDHKEQKPLFALNATTGEKLWSTTAPANAPSQLVIAQGMLVLFDGNHSCGYRTSNGSHAWCTTGTINGLHGAGLVSAHSIVYVIYYSFTTNTVVAIYPQNGHLYWSKDIQFGGGIPQIMALGDSLILPENKVILNRADGTMLWQLPGSGFIATSAAGN